MPLPAASPEAVRRAGRHRAVLPGPPQPHGAHQGAAEEVGAGDLRALPVAPPAPARTCRSLPASPAPGALAGHTLPGARPPWPPTRDWRGDPACHALWPPTWRLGACWRGSSAALGPAQAQTCRASGGRGGATRGPLSRPGCTGTVRGGVLVLPTGRGLRLPGTDPPLGHEGSPLRALASPRAQPQTCLSGVSAVPGLTLGNPGPCPPRRSLRDVLTTGPPSPGGSTGLGSGRQLAGPWRRRGPRGGWRGPRGGRRVVSLGTSAVCSPTGGCGRA